MTRMPAVFLAHGAPSIALEDSAATRAMRAFGGRLAGARAIVLASAHWQTRGSARVNAVERPEMIYDFGGFADALYRIRYDAPGDPTLAREVASLLGIEVETKRGWDHGLWTPLLHVLPDANVPVVELSLPMPATPRALLETGAKLAALRDDGVVIAGSGGIVHNLAMIRFTDKYGPPDAWAKSFDDWVAGRVAARDFEALAGYATQSAEARAAVPTPEHFEPLFVVCGASRADDELVVIHDGIEYGNLSLRSFAFV